MVASSECVPSYDSVYLLDKSVKAINRDFAASANSQISDGTIAAVACIMNLTACLSSIVRRYCLTYIGYQWGSNQSEHAYEWSREHDIFTGRLTGSRQESPSPKIDSMVSSKSPPNIESQNGIF